MSLFGPPAAERAPASLLPIAGETVAGVTVGAATAAGAWYGMYLLVHDPRADIEHEMMVLLVPTVVSLLSFYPLGCAAGVTLVGAAAGQHGSFGMTVGWAGVGTAAGVGCAYMCMSGIGGSVGRIAFAVLGFACPPAGAVFGYNISRRKPLMSTDTQSRLLPPDLTFVPASVNGDGHVFLAADLRLVTVRF
jgi:hypothetical protein